MKYKTKWATKSFGDCAELIKDVYLPNDDESFPYVGLEHIEQDTLLLTGIGNSSTTISNKFRFSKGDILFGKLRPYFRKVICPDFDGVCSTDIFVVRPKQGISKKFLFFWMASQDFVDLAYQGSTGTKMPRADWDFLCEMEKNIPEFNTQEKISTILWTIQQLIINLNKQNKILEQIAQTIFKSWFVDFDGESEFVDSELGKIPKGWKVDKVENHLKFTKGVSYKSNELVPSKKALVTLKSVNRGGGYTERGLKAFDGEHKDAQIVFENEIIIAQTDLTQDAAVIGKPALIRKQKKFDVLIASLDLLIARPKNNDGLKLYFYHMFMTDEFQNYVYGYTNGTGVLHLAKNAIQSYRFAKSPEEMIKKFDKLASAILQKYNKNHYQIEDLIETRDSLLPKLMSGEIRV